MVKLVLTEDNSKSPVFETIQDMIKIYRINNRGFLRLGWWGCKLPLSKTAKRKTVSEIRIRSLFTIKLTICVGT